MLSEIPYANASIAMEVCIAALSLRGLYREAMTLKGAEVLNKDLAQTALAAVSALVVDDKYVNAAAADAKRALNAVLSG